jgi:hypothetical protein
MKTYKTWTFDKREEFIEAPNSFSARKEFAAKHKLDITDVMARVRSADIHVQIEGSIYILFGMSDAGKAWLKENLPDDAMTWGRGGVVVEHRFVADIVAGAIEAGLEVL